MFRRVVSAVVMGSMSWMALAADEEGQPQRSAQKMDAGPVITASWQEPLETALQQPVTVDFRETPLTDVVAFLGKQTGPSRLLLDLSALDDVGLGKDTPITAKLTDMSLRCVLRHLLGDLGLTWVFRNGAIVITSEEASEEQVRPAVFPVDDLIRPSAPRADDGAASAALIAMLCATVGPQTWDTVGGPGSIRVYRGALVVAQTQEVLAEVRDVLAAFRAARQLADGGPGKPPPVPSVAPGVCDPVTLRLQEALDTEIPLRFVDTPLEEVVQMLAQACHINIIIDRRCLDNTGPGTDPGITFDAEKMKLRHGLTELLRSLRLTWVIDCQALMITSVEEASQRLRVRAYPVADLLGRAAGVDLFGRPSRTPDLEDLATLITASVQPQTWDEVGGPGSIGACPAADVLLVSQTEDVHAQVTELLDRLRQTAAPPAREAGASQPAPAAAATRLVVHFLPQEVSPPAIPEQKLMDLVTGLIQPDSWKNCPDVYINSAPGRLIVRHTEFVHRQIEQLLAELFRPRPPAAGGAEPAPGGAGFF